MRARPRHSARTATAGASPTPHATARHEEHEGHRRHEHGSAGRRRGADCLGGG